MKRPLELTAKRRQILQHLCSLPEAKMIPWRQLPGGATPSVFNPMVDAGLLDSSTLEGTQHVAITEAGRALVQGGK